MAVAGSASVGTIPVQHLRAGDHAFVSYADDDAGRDVVSAFAWAGLVKREKVMVFAAPHLHEEQVWNRLDAPGALLGAARENGQLVLSSMRALIHPQDAFTPHRQWDRITEETDQALAEGYSGLRTYIDMHWVGDLGADVQVMMHRESHAQHLFTGRPYTEICAYDSRWFDPGVLTAMHEAHPCRLLPRLGALHVEHAEGLVQLTGEADIATREEFIGAVREGLRRSENAQPLTVDLGGLVFLGVACAVDLLRLVLEHAHGPVRVHCPPTPARILRRAGADQVPHMVISEVDR
ncbi:MULTISPECIES: MEDS domain-containing protein [unclassified Streptomyces]|uniref:MEDS domain-containing protein n=1 Tax=unclassified Streptomyces TaxID=2593676 RepID=UPI0033E39211